MSGSVKRARVPGMSRRTVRALILVPDPEQAGLTQAERLALRLRRDASINGSCVCGAIAPPIRYRSGEVVSVTMLHEHDCPAADGPHLDRLAVRLGSRLVYQTIRAEIEVGA